uniref:Uncharacterized protein n=1 Tax=Oryzias latipes TaxID=8090 RepID=A0A3P9HC53_ORYLA
MTPTSTCLQGTRDEQHAELNMVPTVGFDGGGATVWTGIPTQSKTHLVIVDGPITARFYRRDTVEHVRTFPSTVAFGSLSKRLLCDLLVPFMGCD